MNRDMYIGVKDTSVGNRKRKADADAGSGDTTYNAFTAAAAAVTQLYTISVQQQEEQRKIGARDALIRLYEYLSKEGDAVDLETLKTYLMKELNQLQ